MADDKASWAGFAEAALNALGRSAPWVVIGCLSAFGIYMLQKQSQDSFTQLRTIAAEERKLAADDFQAANKTLQDTYGSVKTLTDAMLASFQSQLTQLRTLEDSVREKQAEVFDRRLEVEQTLVKIAQQRTEMERSRAELERLTLTLEARKEEVEAAIRAKEEADSSREAAIADAEELRQQLSREQSLLEDTRSELVQNRQQLDEVGRDLDGRKAELEQAVDKVRDVLAVLRDVANADPNTISSDLAALRERAREVVPRVSDFLDEYSTNPERRGNLDPSSIVGASLGDVIDGMQSNDQVEWFVENLAQRDPSRDETTIIGVPLEAYGESAVADAIIISFSSKIDADALRGMLEDPDWQLPSDVTVRSARLDSYLAFRCVDTDDFQTSGNCSIRNQGKSASYGSGQGTELFTFIFGFWEVDPLSERPVPAIAFMDPSQAVAFARENGLMPEIGSRFSTRQTLLFADNAAQLSAAKPAIVTQDLSEAEADKIEQWLGGEFRKAFNPDTEFLSPVIFDPENKDASKKIGGFVSEMGYRAMQFNSAEIEVAATRTKSGILLNFDDPIELSFAGSEPIELLVVIEDGTDNITLLVEP